MPRDNESKFWKLFETETTDSYRNCSLGRAGSESQINKQVTAMDIDKREKELKEMQESYGLTNSQNDLIWDGGW